MAKATPLEETDRNRERDDAAIQLDKDIKTQDSKDAHEQLLKPVDKDMDSRELWSGLTRMRNEFQPRRYYFKGNDGNLAAPEAQATAMAYYLTERQRAPTKLDSIETEFRTQSIRACHAIKTPIIEGSPHINTADISYSEF